MRKNIIFISIILFSLAFANIIGVDKSDLRAYKGNFFESFFKDPIEKLVIQFIDGEYFYFTTLEEPTVDMDGWTCVAILEQNGRDIADAIIVIHNHPMGRARFSKGDINFLHTIEKYGFKGVFLLYHQPTQKIYPYVK